MDLNSVLFIPLWTWVTFLLSCSNQESELDYPDFNTVEDSDSVLVFTSLIEPPFLMRTITNTSNENKLEGFIADLIHMIADKMKMPYRLQLVAQGGYGVQHNGKWNGMIGELLNGEADIAAGALTTNRVRKEVIDFSRPYMEVGIATVVKRPPEGQDPPVMSPWELANRPDMEYGMIPGTLTQHFFRTSNDSVIKKIWNKMYHSWPSVFEWTSRKGIERVRESNGKYAFFVESSIAEYLVSQPPCDLMILDQFLNPKTYAFAVPKGSKYLKTLNRALRQLLFSGAVDAIFHKWWHGECDINYPASFEDWSHDRKQISHKRQQDTYLYTYEDPSISYDYPGILQNANPYYNNRTTQTPAPPFKGWTRQEPRSLNQAIIIDNSMYLSVISFTFHLCIFFKL